MSNILKKLEKRAIAFEQAKKTWEENQIKSGLPAQIDWDKIKDDRRKARNKRKALKRKMGR